MTSLSDLLAQKEALEQKIAAIKKEERSNAIAQARALIEAFDLSADELFSAKKPKATRATVAPKYRNPQTGETWTGRGRAPKWLEGKDRTVFAI